MLEARIGLDPWSAFHDVLSQRTGLSFGRISQIIGLTLIVFSRLALEVRPGVATVLNMLTVGPWIDLLRPYLGLVEPGLGIPGVLQFVAGIAVLGVATAVYIGARMGAGPRDGLVLGIATRLEKSVRASRISVEVCVLLTAAVLGGSIGLGTVLFALLMGPTMQTSLRFFHVSSDPSPAARGER